MYTSIGVCLFVLVLSFTELNTSYIMKIDAFAPSWHEFKNSVIVEIRLLHSQPFTYTNSHSHFVIEELANFQVLSHRPKQMEVQQGKARTTY
jgi:hypothetical protein